MVIIQHIVKIICFVLTLILFACSNGSKKNSFIKEAEMLLPTRLDMVLERGKLIATTDYNSTNYFIYKGTPQGYQFDLLQAFADHLGVKLEIKITRSLNEAFNLVNKGTCDIIAMDMTVTRKRKDIINFTIPHTKTRQVLVQQKPKNWRKIKTWDELESTMLRDPIDLAGETIYIQKNTSFKQRLINLMSEIGDTIYVIESPTKEMEKLISEVANGDIKYTIADEHVALVNSHYYADIDVKTPVSFSQNLAWAVSKGNNDLLDEVNLWLEEFTNEVAYVYIYNKYFRNPRYVNIANSEYFSITGNKISKYDSIIKGQADEIGWDWRLLASMIYQESGFQEHSKSWVGAWGIMQLMPATMEMFGIDSTATPEQQIMAGVRLIKWLNKEFTPLVPDSVERRKFVMASYNVGIAHVLDAIRLAEKYDADPQIWTGNVDYYLRKKSDPEYFNDEVVYYGYARGEEPFQYVNEIYDRYNHYRNIIL